MNLGKKILSAFVEVGEEEKPAAAAHITAMPVRETAQPPVAENSKFRQHFEKLFAEANRPGPDYYEFVKMVDAMTVIPDERSRYLAAFAGLSVQGLNKETLLSTAVDYLKLVETDAAAFEQTLDATLQEKVQAKQKEMEGKKERIQKLTQEITALHSELASLQSEIKENEVKIYANSSGYKAAAENMKARITADVEKIKQYLS